MDGRAVGWAQDVRLRWRRLVVVQECYCRAVKAGVAAELGFDQSGDWDGVLGEHSGVTSAQVR
jgi:hypothetical protein